MSLFSLLERSARRWPDGTAVCVGERQHQTWGELSQRALRLAGRLASGSRIAVASENAPEFLELMFGTWAARAAIVPINYKLHALEMAQVLEDADPALIFASPGLAPALRLALPAGAVSRVVEIGSAAYESLFEGATTTVTHAEPEALAWLFYTSGTTGRSKGAMLSHRNLMAMTLAHLADLEQLDVNASLIHAAPMSHGSGLYIPAYVACGARQVVPASRGFDPDEFIALCGVHPGCGSFLAPTMVQRLRVAVEASGHKLPTLRSIVYGGGPMYVEELRKSLAVFGSVFAQIYGQGESPMTITGMTRADHETDDVQVLGSVGTARTGVVVRILDEEGRPLAPGEIGEIVCRGDAVMSGYWNNPEGTAEALRDGWLHTGDMGMLDSQGRLTLRDRSKDVVISGGSNIYPREVEEALLTHASVAEIAVIGEPDEEWGEVVVAFVVPTLGSAPDTASLDAHCLERIARFKRPKRYVFIDRLPKNNYGKVLKRELRQQCAQSPGEVA